MDREDPKPVAAPPSEPPKLVFRPNEKKAARMALVRRLLLWTAMVIVGVGIVLIVRYKPAPFAGARTGADTTGARTFVPPPPPAAPLRTAAEPPAADNVGRLISLFRTEAAVALRLVRRYAESVPAEPIAPDNAAKSLDKARAALAVLDSAQAHIAAAGAAAEGIEQSIRKLAGDDAYRLSALYAKAEAYLSAVRDDAKTQGEVFEAFAASARAALAGDPGETAVKQNAATGLLRQMETRQKNRERRTREFDEAVQRYYR